MKKQIIPLNVLWGNRVVIRGKNSRKGRGTSIVLTVVPVAVNAIIAVLKMPTGYAKRVIAARKILSDCTGNANVTIAPADLSPIATHITTYENSTVAGRPDAWRIVMEDMNWLMGLFQKQANTNPATAIVVIESGGFFVKKVTNRQKQIFSATHGAVSGRIDLIAKGIKARSAHDWYYSADGITWIRLMTTIAAETFILDLTPGRLAYFNHQAITKDGPQGLEGAISIMVN